jgi:CRISPR-associated endoribonuclease Cas6
MSERLSAVVIQIQALQAGKIHGGTGRSAHGLWLNPWKELDSPLGERFHLSNQRKPFTLSPLMGLPRPSKGVTTLLAGNPAWLRLTTLSTASSDALQVWLEHLPAELTIAGIPFQVLGIARTHQQHAWAGQSTYQDLASASFFNPRRPDRWLIHFETPTTFHGVSGHFPFPLPDSLVKSWLSRWKEFATSVPLSADLPDRIREVMVVSSYELKTVPVRYGKRLTVGCVGHIFLRGGRLLPAERAEFDVLSAYAFYAGTGQYTPQGMGLTRAAWGNDGLA